MRKTTTLPHVVPMMIYALIIIPLFLWLYIPYLTRPTAQTWRKVAAYLTTSGRCADTPVAFEPRWLENYAADHRRLSGCPVRYAGEAQRYWLVSMYKQPMIRGYSLIESTEIDGLRLILLERKPNN